MIGLDNVSFAYGDKQVLRGCTLALPECGAVALMGRSGGGKTTMLRLLAGLEQPDAGRVCGMTDRRVALLFQEDRLLPWYTARQNLALVCGDKAQDWLTRVGLAGEENRYPDELSGGMRRRVALARALAMQGDVLLLDEPTDGLDAATRADMWALIRDCAQGRLLVVVTHSRKEADALGAEVVEVAGAGIPPRAK